MNSPLHPSSQPPFTGYGFESGRFFSQQSTPPNEPFDDENQLPTPAEFEAIVDDYLNNLSPKKRDKALVDQKRYQLIQQVLKDPRNTAISTAQFRFWVKKMFQLQPGTIDLVCHDSKPVAMKEQIYSILVRAHREAQHGGRDKTSALVRRQYSWIPKELVARFVRHCPFCITRRNGGQSPGAFAHKSTSSLRYTGRHTAAAAAAAVAVTTAPPILCTPSMQEDSDISSSGPPSTENGYDASPQYISSSSSPSRRGFLYDRDEEELLRSYHNYMGYYYPNVLGIAPCDDNHHHQPNHNTSPAFLRTPGAGETADILAHQEDHSTYHLSAPSTNHFMPYTSNEDTNTTTILPAYD
ncbi:hypothetical protein BDA99DRAFT_433543 [Phascolomyces articulosus]|uniref:Integrase zinc-binding domain-containing protein n=1 Tax=Phascolomyces articulosus TaxID=60185 RepID=A0AAD5KGF9_9FUNG|nr:hypothetical protein BDA99DRAFT_433543 [Phascolomyces articulosus]